MLDSLISGQRYRQFGTFQSLRNGLDGLIPCAFCLLEACQFPLQCTQRRTFGHGNIQIRQKAIQNFPAHEFH
ncbi:hypothetical protein LMG23992_02994 [Cupriavidus laharis]|uniref:Uncharacterized protein n=1 Tax=Cupriavidus laharis TaxID=151654 RepID=A0ABN7YQD1_9BURK|nr:hypothetical protein LMG23992_02994 [Cupriavidus laharis]